MKRSSYREHDHAFGQRMLRLRTAIGLTQAGLAQILGVSRHAVGEWELGQSYPKVEHLKNVIALGFEQGVFTNGREAEDIRELWRAARQKVLLDTEWLHELLRSEAPVEAAPSNTQDSHAPHNLPSQLTPFVGREAEIATITGFLQDVDRRLITIVGVGGVGKTRQPQRL
jgi:transcriptional regulator with XRE-family HTH domain